MLPAGDILSFALHGVKPEREFFLLAGLGADLSGALTVAPLTANGHTVELQKDDDQGHEKRRDDDVVMLELARAVGISVPEIRLVPISNIRGLPPAAARMEGKTLVVQRFDRAAGGRRIHMEDFAQVFGLFHDDKYGHRSYADIASVLWAETGDRTGENIPNGGQSLRTLR